MIKRTGGWLRIERVEDSSFEAWLENRRAELGLIADKALNQDLGIPEPGPSPIQEDAGDTIKDAVVDDARTLWVEYDSQGERHREWRKVVQDSSVSSWTDWPHQGPQSTLHMLKHCLRHGGGAALLDAVVA